MYKIIVLAGPTCVGKTEYAIKLANILNGEIVSSDSMQIYKYMDIGSAKPTNDEMHAAKHHLVDFVDPMQDFSVADYQKEALKAIDDIISRGKIPIVSGGTGLYINSLIYKMDFSGVNSNFLLRKELEKIAAKEGKDKVHSMLCELSPEKAEEIHPNNLKKVIRAIEIIKSGGLTQAFSDLTYKNEKFDIYLICLTRNREELYDRINKRVDLLIENGLIEEVISLRNMGLTYESISMKGIGYKEIIAHLNGEYDLETGINLVKRNTRRYAKRQLTWFKRYENAKWFNLSQNDTYNDILNYLKEVGIYE